MPTLLYGFSIPELSRLNSGGGYNLRRIHDQAADCSVRHAERPVSKRNQARCSASSVHVSINPEVPLSLASSATALAARNDATRSRFSALGSDSISRASTKIGRT